MLSPTMARWWPALPSSWFGTNIAALFAVIAYCWLLAFALLATFIWTSWVPGGIAKILWWSLAITWCAGVVYNHFFWKPAPTRGPLEQFRAAQEQYLRGEWFETQITLKAILRENPLDAEALLLLASAKRRAGKKVGADQVLQQLELLDAGAIWQFELNAERKLLAQQDDTNAENPEIESAVDPQGSESDAPASQESEQ